MTDHAEEQQMEAEALEAIFENYFTTISPHQWSIDLYPEHARDDCHVACRLRVDLPVLYPDEALPILSIEIITGLATEHIQLLQNIANEEAIANEGSPSIFAVAERLREWLLENNVKGLDDQSMHAQMMRKKIQESNQKAKQNNIVFESQKHDLVILTEAEQEELSVRARRADGTPCNKENFDAWWKRFVVEQQQKLQETERCQGEEMVSAGTSGNNTVKHNSGEHSSQVSDLAVTASDRRLTGYDFFTSKAGGDLAALEAAAEAAEEQEEDDEEELIDEDLFKEEDDVDLDDLDFDEDDVDDEVEDDVDI